MNPFIVTRTRASVSEEGGYTTHRRHGSKAKSRILETVEQENRQRNPRGAVTGKLTLACSRHLLKVSARCIDTSWRCMVLRNGDRDLRPDVDRTVHRTRNKMPPAVRVSIDRRIVLDRSTFHGVAWRDRVKGVDGEHLWVVCRCTSYNVRGTLKG